MGKLKMAIVLLWRIWRNRKAISLVLKETEEVYNAMREALYDKKITKEELKDILEESSDVLLAISAILGGK